MNRRSFLIGSTAASLAAGCHTPAGGGSPARAYGSSYSPALAGTQLSGWGQYYERQGRDMTQYLSEILFLVRDAGYDYAESSLDVAHPNKNGDLAALMIKRGLRPVSLYTGGAFHVLGKATQTAERIAVAAKAARKAGFSGIVCNPDPIGRDKTDAELAIQSAALTEMGRELNKLGMWLGLHHHTPEMRNGAREFHANFSGTPPGSVGFCYDVHWVFRGGLTPAEVLPRYDGRIVSWHLRQSREGIWWEDLAEGDIHYAAVARHVEEHRIPRRFTVELALEPGTKITRNVSENHQRSRQFLRQVFQV